MKLYFIAGEASGDLHGSNLFRALLQINPHLEARAWGGDLMEAAGAQVVKHYRDLAFMGFVEVARNLRTILRNLAWCKADILAFQPQAIVLIDYPGFNLRIARWAKAQGFRVIYYISPQIWAWHRSRVHTIKAAVDQMLTILPFERDFYARYDYAAEFVGHPLLDVVDDYVASTEFRAEHQLDERPILALLPGSRRQEIANMLPVMLTAAAKFPAFQVVVGGAPGISPEFYQPFLARIPAQQKFTLVHGQTYALLAQAKAALVTSGTATLETALFRVPQVVVYRGNPLSYWIARRLVQVPYISLVNLIADEPLVQELIQEQLHPTNLQRALEHILQPTETERLQAGYTRLRQRLGHHGASARAAQFILLGLHPG